MSFEREVSKLGAALSAERGKLAVPGYEALWPNISTESGLLVMRLIRRIEREMPELFGVYGSLEELQVAVIDVFDVDEPAVNSAGDLLSALEAVADQQWVIATPIANLMPPTRLEGLSEHLALVPASPHHGEWFRIREEVNAYFGARFHQFDSRISHDGEGRPVDTRRGAWWLVSLERGSLAAARERAMVTAQLILATWTLLKPPLGDTFMPLWPVASEWLPQPHFHVMQRSIGLGPDSDEQNATVVYDPDEASLYRPPEGDLRLAPVRALSVVATNRPAVRLLGAAWSLYLAARPQTELQWIDRLMFVQRARNQLCEPDNPNGRWQERWRTLAANLSIAAQLRKRGFDAEGIRALDGRAWDLRNIGAHSGDAVLISLGFPADRDRPLRRRASVIDGAELAPLHVREGVEAPFAAACLAAGALWQLMLGCGFDEAIWESRFGSSTADPGATLRG